MLKKPRKYLTGFILIELLMVIAILALLMSIIVITLNPTEMLKKSRDAKRMGELKVIDTALGIFQANKSTTSMGNASTTYVSIPASNSNCSDLGLPTGYTYSCSTSANYKKTDGTGWIPVNFNSLDIGSPLVTLPTDPTNSTSTGLYYTYNPGGSWELTALFESNIYKMGGDNDMASRDGGIYPELYESGTDLTLLPYSRDPNLIGYWKLNKYTSGSIVNNQTDGFEDSSGQGNNGTAKNSNGTGMAWAQGKAGGAVSFDGVDDYVNVPNNSSFHPVNEVTVSVWIKPSQKTGYGGIAGAHTNNSYQLFLWGNEIRWDIKNVKGRNLWSTGITVPWDAWTHLVVTYTASDGMMKVYVNGIVTSKIHSYGAGNIVSSTSTFLIGYSGYSTEYFNGLIDEVRIYNRALSAAEISAIYNATR